MCNTFQIVAGSGAFWRLWVHVVLLAELPRHVYTHFLSDLREAPCITPPHSFRRPSGDAPHQKPKRDRDCRRGLLRKICTRGKRRRAPPPPTHAPSWGSAVASLLSRSLFWGKENGEGRGRSEAEVECRSTAVDLMGAVRWRRFGIHSVGSGRPEGGHRDPERHRCQVSFRFGLYDK